MNSINMMNSSLSELCNQGHIYFEGDYPQQQIPSIAQSLQTTTHRKTDLIAKQCSFVNGMSDFVLLFDDVTKKFHLDQFGGVLRLKKSREDAKINDMFSDFERAKGKEAVTVENTGKCKSFVDFMIQMIKADNRSMRPHNKLHSCRTASAKQSIFPVLSKKCSTGQMLNRKIRKPNYKPKKSKLLRAAERAVGLSKKARQNFQHSNIKPLPRHSKESQNVLSSTLSLKLDRPQRLGHKVEHVSPKANQMKEGEGNVLSDKDLTNLADELEEELGGIQKGKSRCSRKENEEKEDLDQGHSINFSDFGSDLSDYSDVNNDVVEDSDTGEIHVIVDDNPKFMSSKRRLSENVRSPRFDRRTMSSPQLPTVSLKKPISLKELATNENLRVLKTRSTTPIRRTPEIESYQTAKYLDAKKSEESAQSDFDEDALDRALDILESEASEED